ncbi:MAG TPA: YihY family inner membrane protein [Burkholderiaceae bacterium]|jgi:membrane protein|nr:YihY family inner membrane protein [Burkholderiaceae bacterium]
MQGLKDPPPEPDTHSPTSVRTAAESRRAARATAWKVLKYALKRADEKKLAQVAASLTYTTVLSLVPLLAVVLSLFTAFPLFADFRIALETFLAGSLMPAVVSENVMSYLNQFAAKASGLTAVGSLFLIVTSVMLFRTIDEAFNDIWQVETRRPLRQRMLVYWAVLSLGPILVGASLWALSVVARESLGLIGEMNAFANVSLALLPLLLTGFGFTALFLTVPNRSVRWKDALAGGFLTALILEALRVGIAYYLSKFPSYTIIYGTFATIPIFLLWVYLSWLVILLGATVTALLPALRQRRWAQQHYIGAAFVDGVRVLHALWNTWRTHTPGRQVGELCTYLSLHQDELDNVLHVLKRLGYVVNTQHEDTELWVMACDPARAELQPMIDAWLLDTEQPGLREEPQLIDAVARSLSGESVNLDVLFRQSGLYHNNSAWGTISSSNQAVPTESHSSQAIPTEKPGERIC